MLSDIEREDVPAVYEIGVCDGGKGFRVYLHKEALAAVQEKLASRAGSVAFQRGMFPSLPEFISLQEGNWGFGEVMQQVQSNRPDWLEWRCTLPAIGVGFLNYNWDLSYPLSSTLQLLFQAVNFLDARTTATQNQLLCIDLKNTKDPGGVEVHPIATTLSKHLASWITPDNIHDCHKAVEEVMVTAYQYMSGPNAQPPRDRFGFEFRSGSVGLNIPGDTAGLDPVDGCELVPHNVFSVLQQLALLMGLAAMHDEARKAGF